MGVLVLRFWQSPRELKKVSKFGSGIENIEHNSFLGCPGAVIVTES